MNVATRQKIVAGNWKMNTLLKDGSALAEGIVKFFVESKSAAKVVLCPPFPYLAAISQKLGSSGVDLGAQNASQNSPGAFTGEIALDMLVDCGCRWVIIGHSERRQFYGDTDDLICKKLVAVIARGLKPIFCVGEMLADREAGRTEAVLDGQLAGGLAGVTAEQLCQTVIAYEPVWAIGTGKTATPEQADQAHAYIRKWIESRYNAELAGKIQILYGGSVKPDNAAALMALPNVDGALVGGASLKLDQFLPIIQAAG